MSGVGETVLKIPENATIGSVDSLFEQVTATLNSSDVIVVDFSAIKTVDISFVQLLISAKHTATRDGKKMRLSAPASGPLLEILEQAGLLSKENFLPEDRSFWLNS